MDRDSELVVLEVSQDEDIHHIGAIRFGPDGMLYASLGDGGRRNESQNRLSLQGSVIRIDVSESSAASPYAVPPNNPFVGQQGTLPEIWAFGFRNPWRMTFDPATGVLWAGDVGEENHEEIDRVVAGGNYGWPRFEGSLCHGTGAQCDAWDATVPPVVEYSHDIGCAVMGGVVYRGEAIPALVGYYLFSDFCSKKLWAMPLAGGGVVELATFEGQVSSFGTDADGEVYLLRLRQPVLRIVAADQ